MLQKKNYVLQKNKLWKENLRQFRIKGYKNEFESLCGAFFISLLFRIQELFLST